jgi:hypothetical protein
MAAWAPEPVIGKAPETKHEPRDIAELLRDFDLPPVHGAAASTHDARPAPASFASPSVLKSRLRFAIPPAGPARWRRLAVVGLVVVALGEGGLIAVRALRKPPPPKLGTLSLQTNPPGVAVFVDGVAHGNTPARISLDAGSHVVELRGRGVPRVIPVVVTARKRRSTSNCPRRLRPAACSFSRIRRARACPWTASITAPPRPACPISRRGSTK